MAFNRDRNSRGGSKPRFNDRGSSRGPVEMHKVICDNCGRECEVPFRPTSGKPVYCSNCFENQRGGDQPRRNEDSPRFGEASRQMFDAVCDECGNKCQVPFQPSGDKPVFCSNCFGEKKNAGSSGNSNSNDKFDQLNAKLDQILSLLSPTEKPTKKAKKGPKVSEAPADTVVA